MSSFSSLLNRIRRRMLGSPRRTRTQSTSLEAKPRRRYVFVVFVHICPYWMDFILCGCWINVEARVFPVFKTMSVSEQKWSKGKVRDKLNNLVLFDKATYDKLYKEVPNYKLITPAVVSERLKIRGSLARNALQELLAKGELHFLCSELLMVRVGSLTLGRASKLITRLSW